jgi:hypothetical protein
MKGEEPPLLPQRTKPKTKTKPNKKQEKKFTLLAFWEALLDLPPCPPGHVGQMISCKIVSAI